MILLPFGVTAEPLANISNYIEQCHHYSFLHIFFTFPQNYIARFIIYRHVNGNAAVE